MAVPKVVCILRPAHYRLLLVLGDLLFFDKTYDLRLLGCRDCPTVRM